jgi:hypothetical protein
MKYLSPSRVIRRELDAGRVRAPERERRGGLPPTQTKPTTLPNGHERQIENAHD